MKMLRVVEDELKKGDEVIIILGVYRIVVTVSEKDIEIYKERIVEM